MCNTATLLDEMSPDALMPYLVERRLLSPEKATDVKKTSSRVGKAAAILQALIDNGIVGRLPTLCGALLSARLPHIAERLSRSESTFSHHVIFCSVPDQFMCS